MKYPKMIQSPITKEDMKDAVKFTIHHTQYSGKRNPKNKKRWLIHDDFLDEVVYDYDDGDGVVYFINEECKKQTPTGKVTIEYSNKLKGYVRVIDVPTSLKGYKTSPKTKSPFGLNIRKMF